MRQVRNLLSISAVILYSCISFAGAPNYTTFQTKILAPSGLPLESAAVNFRFTILDSFGTCVLYIEDYIALNMTGSLGVVSFSLGSGTKSYPGTATSMSDIFNNTVAVPHPCQAGGTYAPGANDRRQIVMQFNDGSGWQTLPQMAINSVFYANYATTSEKLGDYVSADYLRPATLPSCAGGQALHYNGTSFTCVTASGGGGTLTSVNVNSPLTIVNTTTTPVISLPKATGAVSGYLSSADWAAFNAKASATLTSGSLYIGNASNAATGVTLSGDATLNSSGDLSLKNSGVGAGTYGSSSSIPAITIDVKGRVTSATSTPYQNATGAAKGVVQVGSNISIAAGVISITSTDISNALSYTPSNGNQTFLQNGNSFSANANIGTADNYNLNFVTSGTPKMTVQANGNVGIGTTTPTNLLQVTGVIGIGSSSGKIDMPADSSVFVGTGNTFAGISKGSSVVLGTGNTLGSGMASDNAVAIGIGNSTGYNNSVTIGRSNSTGQSDTSAAIGIANSVGTDGSFAVGISNVIPCCTSGIAVGIGITNNVNGSLQIGPSNAAKITILSGGNVGIGTTTPTFPLTVNGQVGIGTGFIRFGGAAYGESNGLNVGISNSVDYNNSMAMGRSNSTGSADSAIAIGLNNSAGRDSAVLIGNGNAVGTNGYGGIAFGRNNTVSEVLSMAYGYGITNGTPNSLMIGPSDSAKLTILSTGNVGIGTTTPTSMLQISGGSIVSDSVANTVAFINFGSGNMQVTNTAATTINLCGLKDGGAYTLILTGIAAASTVTVNGYKTYTNTTTCSGAVTVDLGAGATTFTTAGATNILTFIYTTKTTNGQTLYGSPSTNFNVQ